jgi:hypothetical protein
MRIYHLFYVVYLDIRRTETISNLRINTNRLDVDYHDYNDHFYNT